MCRRCLLSPGSALTFRETQVIEAISQGSSNRTIADELHITERTVKAHVHNAFCKLHVTSRLQAALCWVSYRAKVKSIG